MIEEAKLYWLSPLSFLLSTREERLVLCPSRAGGNLQHGIFDQDNGQLTRKAIVGGRWRRSADVHGIGEASELTTPIHSHKGL